MTRAELIELARETFPRMDDYPAVVAYVKTAAKVVADDLADDRPTVTLGFYRQLREVLAQWEEELKGKMTEILAEMEKGLTS